MNTKAVIVSAVAYTMGTFVLAVLWHVVLFKSQYEGFGYFEGEPNFLLGLVTIAIQGTILSVLFPLFRLSGTPILRSLKFCSLVGIFFWTSHVLAFMAKQTINNAVAFAVMESFYLLLQFGLFAVMLGIIYRHEKPGA